MSVDLNLFEYWAKTPKNQFNETKHEWYTLRLLRSWADLVFLTRSLFCLFLSFS